jgi:hypothetical protein
VIGIFDDLDLRFEYPGDWDLEVLDDGSRTTVTVQSPGGLAFAMITLDEERPAPSTLADEALSAMREEYPGLEATPALETIDGQRASGHDIEFVSLDMLNSCAIRCYRTPRRTILVFNQWSDLDEGDPEAALRALRRSIEETA